MYLLLTNFGPIWTKTLKLFASFRATQPSTGSPPSSKHDGPPSVSSTTSTRKKVTTLASQNILPLATASVLFLSSSEGRLRLGHSPLQELVIQMWRTLPPQRSFFLQARCCVLPFPGTAGCQGFKASRSTRKLTILCLFATHASCSTSRHTQATDLSHTGEPQGEGGGRGRKRRVAVQEFKTCGDCSGRSSISSRGRRP